MRKRWFCHYLAIATELICTIVWLAEAAALFSRVIRDASTTSCMRKRWFCHYFAIATELICTIVWLAEAARLLARNIWTASTARRMRRRCLSYWLTVATEFLTSIIQSCSTANLSWLPELYCVTAAQVFGWVVEGTSTAPVKRG